MQTGSTSKTTPTHPLATTGPINKSSATAKPGQKLENRIYPIRALEGAGYYAADDWGVAAFNLRRGVEEELKARSGGVGRVSESNLWEGWGNMVDGV